MVHGFGCFVFFFLISLMKKWGSKSNWVSWLGLWRGGQVCEWAGDKGCWREAGLFQDRLPWVLCYWAGTVSYPPCSLHFLLGPLLFPLSGPQKTAPVIALCPSATWLQPWTAVSVDIPAVERASWWLSKESGLRLSGRQSQQNFWPRLSLFCSVWDPP